MLQPEPNAVGGAIRRSDSFAPHDDRRAEPAEVVAAKAAQAALDGIFLRHVPDHPEIVGTRRHDVGEKKDVPARPRDEGMGRRPAPGKAEIRSWVRPRARFSQPAPIREIR